MHGEQWLDICHSARPPLISGIYARQENNSLTLSREEKNVFKKTQNETKTPSLCFRIGAELEILQP